MASKLIEGEAATDWLRRIINRWSDQAFYIVSPYISAAGITPISNAMAKRPQRIAIILTNLDSLAIAAGYLDTTSLTGLMVKYPNRVTVYDVRNLHAKVYLLQGSEALIGSANLTTGGFCTNVEIGTKCTTRDELEELSNAVERWCGSGNSVSVEEIGRYKDYADKYYSNVRPFKKGVVAFPHQTETYFSVVCAAVLAIHNSGMEKADFDLLIKNQRSQSAEETAPEHRVWFLEALQLVKVRNDKVVRGNNVGTLRHPNSMLHFASLLCQVFPESLEILRALQQHGQTTTWTDSEGILRAAGLGHLVGDHGNIIRWLVQLEQIQLCKGGMKNIRSFKVSQQCPVLKVQKRLIARQPAKLVDPAT